MESRRYRGYQRCSRIDYADGNNTFAVTICVKPRRSAFTAPDANTEMIAEMVRIQNEGLWGVYLYCIMLDHIHLVANAGRLGLSKAVMRFKGRVATWWRRNGDGQPLWQSGYFDHRIRHAEGFRDKCSYILQNPVRAGLVVQAEDYAWSGSLTQR